MPYQWDSDATLELIDMFRDRPVLWNISKEDHKHRIKRMAAWQEIASHFRVPRPAVVNQVRAQLALYQRDLQRRAAGLLAGDRALFHTFRRLSFLDASWADSIQRQIQFDEEESESESESEEEERPHASRSASGEPESSSQARPSRRHHEHRLKLSVAFEVPRSSSSPTNSSRRRRSPSVESNEVPRKKRERSPCATDQMPEKTCCERKSMDEFSVFGEYVAIKLRNISNCPARNMVQFLFNDILYKAEMGKYDDATLNHASNESAEEQSQHSEPEQPRPSRNVDSEPDLYSDSD